MPSGMETDACGTCLGEALASLPRLPASGTCCLGVREAATAWLSHLYGSCDRYSGSLEGSFSDFVAAKKSVQWGFRGLLPPQPPSSLPPASLSTSGYSCRPGLSLEPMTTGTECQALLQRGCLRVCRSPDSGCFPGNSAGPAWAWGPGVQRWKLSVLYTFSVSTLLQIQVSSDLQNSPLR